MYNLAVWHLVIHMIYTELFLFHHCGFRALLFSNSNAVCQTQCQVDEFQWKFRVWIWATIEMLKKVVLILTFSEILFEWVGPPWSKMKSDILNQRIIIQSLSTFFFSTVHSISPLITRSYHRAISHNKYSIIFCSR